MKKTLYLCFLVMLVLTSIKVEAMPACPYPVKFIQPDGTTIQIYLKGDEYINWRQTVDNYTLMFNKEGYLTYAKKDRNGDLQPSEIIATDIEKRDVKAKSLLANTNKSLFYSEKQTSVLLKIKEVKLRSMNYAKQSEVIGNFKALCVLVDFPERRMVKEKEDFEGLMNQLNYTENGARGSVKDYFLESSYGQFDLTITLVGPYTAPESESYYAGDGGAENGHELASWLAKQADEDVDYSEFDGDDNGFVDNFHFLFAGYGQESSGALGELWSHSSSFQTLVLDGKKVSKYSCSPELSGSYGSNITGIGVIGHEITHAFGAPDYYDVNYETGGEYDGTGRWDMMAGGSWNDGGNSPAHHNMYQKIQFGWVTPELLEDSKTINDIPNSAENSVCYKIETNTPNEYFLVENRQKVKFDTFVPGNGLLIYRVHKDIARSSRTINTTHPQKLYPVCSSASVAIPTNRKSSYGVINSTRTTFPGTKNKTAFTDETIPSMKSWAGEETGKPITNIVEEKGLISFDFMGGDNGVMQYVVKVSEPKNGSVQIKNGDEDVKPGTYVTEGVKLSVVTTPDDGYELESITVNGEIIEGNSFVVKSTMNVVVTFVPNTGINDVDNNLIKVFANNKTINVENKSTYNVNINVIDMAGRIVHNSQSSSQNYSFKLEKTGIYIVRLSCNGIIKTTKVVLK